MPSPELLDRFRADLAALGGMPDDRGRLGLAVSGGPDSLALLLLADAALPGRVAAATVDHGLRAEAAAEAAGVAAICAAIGVPHAILTAQAGAMAGRGSVQARARALRYRRLGAWAQESGIAWIATAHHRDDQAETFLMRAARGAGTAGLAGVRARVTLAGTGVPVLRPLLGWRRAELAAIVAAAGIAAADDPSNRDPAHDRTAFRALLAAAPALRPERLARAAANLADAEEALAWTATRIAAERLRQEDDTILLDAGGLPRDLRRRLLSTALAQLAPAAAIRGDSLDRMLGLLDSGRAATLAGVRAQPGATWRFILAPPRRD